MKISEFIDLLENAKKNCGDAEVRISDYDTGWICSLEDDCVVMPKSEFNENDFVLIDYDLEHS